MKYKDIKIGMSVTVKSKDKTTDKGCAFRYIKHTCGETHKVKEILTTGGRNHFRLENNLYYHHKQLKKG